MAQADTGYDVFISYSHHDRTWVWDWLVPRLEAAGLRVCTDRESFDIGVPSLINMERAVANSRHTILVLSPAWLASQWTEFEGLLVQTSDPAARQRKLMPLLLQACIPPARLAMLSYADFQDAADRERQLTRVVAAIRGELQLIDVGPQLRGLLPAAGVMLARALSDPEHIAAYLEAVRSQCGRTETRPYRQLSELRGATPSFTLRDEADRCGVYVPLRFDLHPARPAGEGLEADERAPIGKASRVNALRDLSRTDIGLAELFASPGHVVFIGAAGCGKTTVLRLVATTLAEADAEMARRDLSVESESLPLPVYVALRDFEHACVNAPLTYRRDVDSLLRFLDDHFARWHPGRVPAGFLSGLVRAGRAWLLLDALDEVADFDHRIAVRQVIEGLGDAFPGNRLLVTARVAAYATPNTRLDERFQVATVRALTREQWAPMVARLYAGLEGNADVAAERTRRLLARIDAAPQLQEMVKTPLMVWTATLIHYADRELPEQRAELYRGVRGCAVGRTAARGGERRGRAAPARRAVVHG